MNSLPLDEEQTNVRRFLKPVRNQFKFKHPWATLSYLLNLYIYKVTDIHMSSWEHPDLSRSFGRKGTLKIPRAQNWGDSHQKKVALPVLGFFPFFHPGVNRTSSQQGQEVMNRRE